MSEEIMLGKQMTVSGLQPPRGGIRSPEEDLALARHEFFELAREPTRRIPEHILRSWQRCVGRGMEVDRADDLDVLTQSNFTEIRERAEALLVIAEPELEFLAVSLSYSGSLVTITDPNGTIIEARGGSGLIEKMIKDALVPGSSWRESARGTNGIGTSIEESHLIEIWGAEHYHVRHSIFCCTAAPILDHTGRIAGVINVTGDAHLPRGYARAVVKRAVREIEYRWMGYASHGLTTLRFHPRSSYLNSPQEGVLLLDGDVVAGANHYALQWLGMDWEIIGKRWGDCFKTPMPTDGIGPLVARQRIQFMSEMKLAPGHSSACSTQMPKQLAECPPLAGIWLNRAGRTQLERARRAVNAGLTTILLGETGTGKEMFARALHSISTRRAGPFVAINCAALPESLIEAELFGYSEGAFTGANRKGSPGRILEAQGGILFLDEIGDMPLALQTQLLRVLQDRHVTPLGGGSARPVDFVVVCATHRAIDAMVAAGSFRADLFYRLQNFVVRLSPWRELCEADRQIALDIFWKEASVARNVRLSTAARACLANYSWPGNLRQCANILRTLVALNDDGSTVEVDALPPEVRCGTRPHSEAVAPESLQDTTIAAIERALARHSGKVDLVARELGIHRSTLYRQIKRMGIPLDASSKYPVE